MSVQVSFRAAGVPSATAAKEAPLAEAAMIEFGITTQARASMFLAQVLHESGGLRYFEEIASGAAYEGRRDLGNTHPGDGRRFKGRGPIQLTGRSNYRWAGKLLGLDLERHPEIAAQHKIGWRIAALYWKSRGLNELADRGDFLEITKRINGGTNGLGNAVNPLPGTRRAYLALLRKTDCRPRDRWAGYTASERRWITEYDRLLKAGTNKARRLVLRYRMRRQARAIRAAAKQDGWTAARNTRVKSLEARSGGG